MKETHLVYKSPIGNWLLTAVQDKLTKVDLIRDDLIIEETFTPLLIKTKQQLEEYFQKKRVIFDLPLNLIGTDFQIKVWRELLRIPYGSFYSYQKLAIKVGDVKAARAVGQANNKNPISIIVPCHRVFGKNGKLVGFGNGVEIQQALLKLEGHQISVKNNNYYVKV